jgi:hypothetical protein
MKINVKKIMSHRIIAWVVFPCVLVLAWAILTLVTIINYDKSFLVLSQNLSQSSFTNIPNGALLKNEKITGSFVAKENNLGIVSIRFKQELRIPYKDEDTLIFRIKEKGANTWYYSGKFMSGLTFDVPFLPFGFPVINNSRGKTYDFELESLSGNTQNGVVVSDNLPNLVAKYQFSKSELTGDKKALIIFGGKKFTEAIQNLDVLLAAVIYLMPLLLYFVVLSMRLKSTYGLYASLLLLMIIIYDIFRLQTSNDLLYVIAMIVWIITLKLQRKTAVYTFLVAIGFIVITPFFYSIGDVTSGLKATSWGYAFFTCGALQLVFGDIHLLQQKK